MTATPASERPGQAGAVSVAGGLLRAVRPKQWLKNLLVLAAPLAAGTLLDTRLLPAIALAFAAFTLAASAIYLVNDTVDAPVDRLHPEKRHRPIASGVVAPQLALAVAALLVVAALGVATLVNGNLVIVVAVYLASQLSYCFWLKRQPVVDICIVASGFLLRAIGGGVAADLPISQWFLLAASFGSLFMVAGKRYAEFRLAERTGTQIRASLDGYTASYLRFVWGLSATILIMTYGLWAFEIRAAHHNSVWTVISLAPFVVAVLRYAVDVDTGNGGEPEEIALRDRVLQVLGLVWLTTLVLAIYA